MPLEAQGSEKDWPAQLLLIAMRFLGPEEDILRKLGVDQEIRSNVKTPEGSFATNIKGVFCAGDARRDKVSSYGRLMKDAEQLKNVISTSGLYQLTLNNENF